MIHQLRLPPENMETFHTSCGPFETWELTPIIKELNNRSLCPETVQSRFWTR